MNKLVHACLAGGLALSGALAASEFSAVKSRVDALARRAGVAERPSPGALGALRSQRGDIAAASADQVLALSEDLAGKVAEKAGVGCSLDNCPHALGLGHAKEELAALSAELADGKGGNDAASYAARLHHAAAGVRLARKAGGIGGGSSLSRSRNAKSAEEAKLELASLIAELSAGVMELSK